MQVGQEQKVLCTNHRDEGLMGSVAMEVKMQWRTAGSGWLVGGRADVDVAGSDNCRPP